MRQFFYNIKKIHFLQIPDSLKVSGLKVKKKYYFRVRVCKKVNGKTYYSGWSNVKSVKAKK